MDHNWMYAPPTASGTGVVGGAGNNGGHSSSATRGSTPAETTKAGHSQPRIRRRNRVINSCLECRRRKLKCDKTAPCANCVRFKRDCLYLASTADPHSQQKLADIKEKMGALEKTLEEEVTGQKPKAHLGGANVTSNPNDDPGVIHVEGDEDDENVADDEVLEPTPLAALDNVYEDNADDELMDLGVQLGRMRISERVGGWIRPKLVEELNDTLEEVMGDKLDASAAQQYSNPQSLRPGPPQPRIQASPKSYIGPGPDYIAPTSSFFFPGTNMNTSLIDYLPSKNAADLLVAQYFLAVHPIARAVHRQTFESQYALFWGQIATGTEPVPSQQALILAAMFSAAVSMSNDQITQSFGTTKAALVDSLRTGTEMGLAKSNFLRTTKLETMQAFVVYLIPLIRAEVSRAHSALLGSAIRLAECMGLHRDGTHYGMKPVEVHVRRMIWHQLCFLDMRTCEATGPRPQIRKDDYDTRFPLNVDDADFLKPNPPTEDRPYWTDMTLFRIRAETFELRRSLWFDVVRIDKKKKTLTSTVVKVQRCRSEMHDRYLPMIDESIPIQLAAKHIMTASLNGCFVQVLHRYLFSTTQQMPDRLRQLLIDAGTTNLEQSILFETKPETATWAWYNGALNQYHAALLLMIEVYAYPMRKDAPRIWKCLDYIFDIPPHLSPKQKGELVITDLRDRMEIYHQMRKIRSTTHLEGRVSDFRRGGEHGSFYSQPAAGGAPEGPKQDLSSSLNSSVPTSMLGSLSPPPIPAPGSSDEGGSRQGSVAASGGADVQMGAMEDIDWAEWDKWFPIEQNTGDLDMPNFNFADFTSAGGYDDASGFAPHGVSGIDLPSVQDLADVSFTPAYFANPVQQGAYNR